MKKVKQTISLIIAVTLIMVACPDVTRAADLEIRKNLSVVVDGVSKGSIMALDLNYDNNVYISLRGLAYTLRETNSAFTPFVKESGIEISTGLDYYEDPHTWDAEELSERSKLKLARNDISVNGVERRYYSLLGSLGESGMDAFMSPVHIAMILNTDIEINNGEIVVNTGEPFSVSDADLENSGYLQGVNSLVIGDGTTGEVYFNFDEDEVLPIASTTKLMTYLVMMDAVSDGKISLNDTVILSSEAQRLSEGIDGVIAMTAGTEVPLKDLINGMLLASSNECALAIAEHIAGSEPAFVDMMNEKADELGLIDAKFYNCNGLPVYENQLLPAKMQNRMSAKEMFTLTSEILNKYPQITDITSVKIMSLPVFERDIKNTNAILYNLDEVKGLKTGTTNKSGACLVSCAQVEKGGEIHNLVSVLLGAEGEYDRSTVSEIAMRYAINKINGNVVETEESYNSVPKNPELVVQKLIRNAMK